MVTDGQVANGKPASIGKNVLTSTKILIPIMQGTNNMAYPHCHNPQCRWSQDDFWSEGFNPITYLLDWVKYLIGDDFREQFTTDHQFLKEHGPLTYQEVVAMELERSAARIRKIVYRNQAEFNAAEGKCPQCGERLDID